MSLSRAGLLLVCALLATGLAARQTAAPTATPLRQYRQGLAMPARMAIDATGRVYHTDTGTGRVVVRDEFGLTKPGKVGLLRPLGIAVDAGGRIYVGEEGRGSVSIYLPDWSFVGRLGRGDGEFQQPNHIAVAQDASGQVQVFVTDSPANLVKVYAASGAFLRQFDGSMGGVGPLNFPTGICVSSEGEVFVADMNNSRVQVFTPQGVFLRAFGKSGMLGAYFGSIQGLAADGLDRIFIADAFQGVVRVADKTGVILTTIGAFGDRLGELFGPSSLGLDRNNRLFVVSAGAGRVDVFGLDGYADPVKVDATARFIPGSIERSDDSGTLRAGFVNLALAVTVLGTDPRLIDARSVRLDGLDVLAAADPVVTTVSRGGPEALLIWIDTNALVRALHDGLNKVVVTGRLLDGRFFETTASLTVHSPVPAGGFENEISQ
jgi:sugar lactone lactonase YvrE